MFGIEGTEIYRVDIQPYQDIAAQYGVGFMVSKFGTFGANVNWDNDVVGGSKFQWSNVTEESATVICQSGETCEYLINKELMDVFQKYTIGSA